MFSLNIEESQALKYGINVHKLKPGTIVFVITKNSMYKIIKVNGDQYSITIQGDKRFHQPINANFSGSTFGGSIIKLGWIGCGMNMEIYVPAYKKTYVTTSVKAARVVGDGWEYDMEWGDNDLFTTQQIN